MNFSVTRRFAAGLLVQGAGAAFFARPIRAQAAEISPQYQGADPFQAALAEFAGGRPGLAEFYAARDWAPIWTDEASVTRRAALFEALSTARSHALPVPRYDPDSLREMIGSVRAERDRARVEVALSAAALDFVRDLASGVTEPSRVVADIVRDIARPDPAEVLAGIAGTDPAASLGSWIPAAPEYGALMRARLDLSTAIARGGWGAEVPGGALRPGASGRAVVALRDRLTAMGYMSASASAQYDDTLKAAVTQFQREQGLTADGIAAASTLAEVNVGPEARLASIVVAMERLRWMRGISDAGRQVRVNLPDFTARILDDGELTFETVAVIGMASEGRQTPEFSHSMEYMVVNPTWNVPRSITVGEYLPMMQRNSGAAGHLKIYDRAGREVNRASVDFSKYTARSFPYSMKQPPSERNALGLVKFMFPNKWNIYLHDTPSKSLFARDVRAFSHGCIRLEKPFVFAEILLSHQSATPRDDFDKVMKTGREARINIQENVPVHLVYFTAWPDARGRISYRRDIYGRDAKLFGALRKAGAEAQAAVV